MDDLEVVREPFDEDEELSSFTSAHTRQSTSNHDTNCQLYNQDGNDYSSEETSSSCQEDINFAKSFGIQLKTSRTKQIESAYERLMKSDHIIETTTHGAEPKPPIKTSVTSDCIYHKGTFYQKGDIVALYDQDDGEVYFAQLTGFLQDQYCEKSATVTWLVPSRPTTREIFDPSAYKIGLEDVQLRKLDCMTFVRRCPHDYYLRKIFHPNEKLQQVSNTDDDHGRPPYLLSSRMKKEEPYIWTTMEPCKVPPIDAKQ